MMDQSEEPKPKVRRRKRILSSEEIWIREFVAFAGTENITRYCSDDLGGVSLTRVMETLMRGELTLTSKCDGPGTLCTYEHYSDEGDGVEVTVWFVATEAALEIREARCVKEDDSEPNAA
jgi:hypothetical protein